jgi:predicted transcriptional regulator
MSNEIRVRSEVNSSVRKRSDIDIMANILDAAKNGTKKTRIMYMCNLSYSQLQVYLQILCEMSLLAPQSKENEKKQNYFKTELKGFKFLEAYRTLKSLMT